MIISGYSFQNFNNNLYISFTYFIKRSFFIFNLSFVLFAAEKQYDVTIYYSDYYN